MTAEVGQLRVYNEETWTVVAIRGNEVELHATDAVVTRRIFRTKGWVKKWMPLA